MTKNDDQEPPAPDKPVWLWKGLIVDDVDEFDFDKLIASNVSADVNELSDTFLQAARQRGTDTPLTTVEKVELLIAAVTGMHFRPENKNEPYGPMMVMEGNRSPISSDFRSDIAVLTKITLRVRHPALRARLSDVCWLLDLSKHYLASDAVKAYVELVRGVVSGSFRYRFAESGGDISILQHETRDLLRRALWIARGSKNWNSEEAISAQRLVVEAREYALGARALIPLLWFSELDLEQGISDPSEIGRSIEAVLCDVEHSDHIVVELWRLAARGFHNAARPQDKARCLVEAAESFVRMAEAQTQSAMIAANHLSNAVAQLTGIPSQKQRRNELQHRLVDVQRGIADEMTAISVPLDLNATICIVLESLKNRSLIDSLFQVACLARSPDPHELRKSAAERARENPLSSLFSSVYLDRKGKFLHRTAAMGIGGDANDSAIERQVAQDESIRRTMVSKGAIEPALNMVSEHFHVSDDIMLPLMLLSPFVPTVLAHTFAEGLACLFQRNYVSAVYILTPLLEEALRHRLTLQGYDVSRFDPQTKTQQDRTISQLFEQMRSELESIFGVALIADLDRVFLSKEGPHLRHSLCHGLLSDGEPYGADAIYGCWLIYRICVLPLIQHRDKIALPA